MLRSYTCADVLTIAMPRGTIVIFAFLKYLRDRRHASAVGRRAS